MKTSLFFAHWSFVICVLEENSLEKEERTYGSIMMERLTGSEGRIDHILQVRGSTFSCFCLKLHYYFAPLLKMLCACVNISLTKTLLYNCHMWVHTCVCSWACRSASLMHMLSKKYGTIFYTLHQSRVTNK